MESRKYIYLGDWIPNNSIWVPLSRIISATEFAEKVRPLMKHKKRIAASMEAFIAKLSAKERKRQEQEKLQQAKRQAEKNNAENWLDSVIKGNK